MKHLGIILLAMLTVFAASACSQSNKNNTMEKKKVLVVYFSATGNTKQTAQKLSSIMDADLCEIIPTQPYTSADHNRNDKQSRSSVEMANPQARPDIKPIDFDINNYDYIFLGYPIWWDLAPRVVNTFIESNDLTGKTIIPFATSGGSSIEESVAALQRLYQEINWQSGKLLNHLSENDIKTWCNKLGISTL